MRHKEEAFFENIGQQHPTEVAALFSFYGINAPVNGKNICNAVRVYKTPFADKLASIVNGGNGGDFDCFGGFDKFIQETPIVGKVKEYFDKQKEISEAREKEAAKAKVIKTAFYGVLIILFLIIMLILAMAFKNKKSA